MKIWWFAAFLMCMVTASAQNAADSVEITISPGDSIKIGTCKSDHFKHLDYYRKTRFPVVSQPYDSATGEGFYRSFFTSGDFDVYELPASYSKKTFVVIGMELLTNKNTREPMYILYLKGPDPNSVIWVDFYEAIHEEEIRIVRFR